MSQDIELNEEANSAYMHLFLAHPRGLLSIYLLLCLFLACCDLVLAQGDTSTDSTGLYVDNSGGDGDGTTGDVGLIIGSVIGGIAVLIVLVFITVCCGILVVLYMNNRKSKEPAPVPTADYRQMQDYNNPWATPIQQKQEIGDSQL